VSGASAAANGNPPGGTVVARVLRAAAPYSESDCGASLMDLYRPECWVKFPVLVHCPDCARMRVGGFVFSVLRKHSAVRRNPQFAKLLRDCTGRSEILRWRREYRSDGLARPFFVTMPDCTRRCGLNAPDPKRGVTAQGSQMFYVVGVTSYQASSLFVGGSLVKF
jgi:hypothetical protein